MRAPWIAGAFGALDREIGTREAFVARLGVEPGAHVLDIACGLPIRFDEGFAATLPYPDGSFAQDWTGWFYRIRAGNWGRWWRAVLDLVNAPAILLPFKSDH